MAVLLETSVGDLAIDLYVDEAPQGCVVVSLGCQLYKLDALTHAV